MKVTPLTAECRVLPGAGGAFRAVAAGGASLVHLAALEVARRAVVADVELGPPGALLVQGVAAADPTGRGPGQLRVVAQRRREPANAQRSTVREAVMAEPIYGCSQMRILARSVA